MAIDPAMLLADEPTGNLDGATGGQIIDLMFALSAKRGTTLVLITHDLALAARCGRCIEVADGSIVHMPPAEGASDAHAVRAVGS